jgi:hypothetical protein
MVTRLHGTLIRQDQGYLRYADGRTYPCHDERAFFAACRAEWVEPEDQALKVGAGAVRLDKARE